MTEPELNTRLQTITPPDEAARAAAHAHWAALAKPLGGLGSLETMLEDAAALTGTPELDFARRIRRLAAERGIPLQDEVVSGISTAITPLVYGGQGVRAAGLSLPVRYHHAPVEQADLEDVAGMVNLLAAFLAQAGGA